MTRRNEALRRLRDLLSGDAYPPGRRLPPERDLAKEMAISRGALRRALAILEGEGLVWRHVGKGTFVGQRPENAGSPSLFGPSLQSAQSVLEVRSILEPTVARMAAERASRTDIARMQAHLQSAETSADTETFNLHCEMLHRSIARATHNAILLRLYDALNPIRSLAHAVGEDVELTRGEMEMYWREHADIIDAITVGDGGTAETAMKRHIRHVWTDTPETAARHDDPGDSSPLSPASKSGLEAALFRPILLELADRFGETVFLSTLRDQEVRIADTVAARSRSQISVHPGVGPRPIADCASAKAILAFLPEARRTAILETAVADTADRTALLEELATVRQDGFARADETLAADIYSLAVPVPLRHSTRQFSIAVIGTKTRMRDTPDDVYVEGIREAIANTVGQLSEMLNALRPYLTRSDDAVPPSVPH